jgi:hypothetical protein
MMEREKKLITDEHAVARILGLPLERIECLKAEFEMPVAEPAFSAWFVKHADIILNELKRQDELRIAVANRRREDALAKTGKTVGTLTGVSVPASYDS